MNNAWDGIADQVGLIKESEKMITVSWITAGGMLSVNSAENKFFCI